MKNLYLYGAGSNGIEVAKRILNARINIDGFVDSNIYGHLIEVCDREYIIKNIDDLDVSLLSLSTMIKNNRHENESNMILKCDAEGAEWDVLKTVDRETLEKISMLVMEFHLFEFSNEEFIVPSDIDSPCNPKLKDVLLGEFGYV